MTQPSRNASLFQWLRAQRAVFVFAMLVAVVAALYYAQRYARRKPSSEISVVYGQRNSREGRLSINGTAVLAEMFKDAGFRVSSWNRLSPKLHRSEVIVWAPDDFAIPSLEQRKWLENWLSEGHARRLIYIGRDYDAELSYWRRTSLQASAEQAIEIDRRIARKKTSQDHSLRSDDEEEENNAIWFVKEKKQDNGELDNGGAGANRPNSKVQWLAGPWCKGIDEASVEIYRNTRLKTSADEGASAIENGNIHGALQSEVLLWAEDDEFVTRLTRDGWSSGKILVVTNGSFLLNMPLVNPEHRKLAGKLIAACGKPGSVVFLESGAGGPSIRESDASDHLTGLEMLFVAPLNVILLHFLAAGVVLLVSYLPIFGRPRKLDAAVISDFSRHVEAMGEQLETIGEIGYCVGKLRYYNEHVRQEASSSPRNAPANGRKQTLRIRITTPIAPGAQDRRLVENFETQVHARGVGQVLHTAFDADGMEIVLSVPATSDALAQIKTLLREFHVEDNSVVSELVQQPFMK